ncbi:MAG: ATP-binding protein [Wenzhouxiangellaceae bacterium]|nr:ATP-binding protein [Wenzhouxiangellaceae bacterium]
MLWLVPGPAPAAEPVFSFLSAGSGLPDARVEALARDAHGYLWIGTQGGLVRHEAGALHVLRHDPDRPDSLPGNNVLALAADGGGGVWAAIAGHGLVQVHGRDVARRWRPASAGGPLPDGHPWSLSFDCEGKLWMLLARGGVVRLDPASGGVSHYRPGTHGLPREGFGMQLLVDSACRIWLALGSSLQVSAALEPPRFRQVATKAFRAPENYMALAEASDGRIWVGGKGGLLRVDPLAAGRPEAFEPAPDFVAQPAAVVSLAAGPSGVVWAGLIDGLVRLDPDGSARRMDAERAGGDRLPRVQVNDVLPVAGGGVWVATAGHGLGRLPPAWKAFRRLGHGDGRLALESVTAVTAGPDGTLWLGGARNGIQQMVAEDAGRHIAQVFPGLNHGLQYSVRGLHVDRDSIRVLALLQLVRIDRATGAARVLRRARAGGDGGFVFLRQAEGGRMWLAARPSTLLQIDAEGRTVDRWEVDAPASRRLSLTEPLDIRRGPEGRWWLLDARRLYRQRADGRFEAVRHDADLRHRAMAFDGDTLWLASDSMLQRLRIEEGAPRVEARYTAGDGLPAGVIQSVVPRSASVWLPMSVGLARLDTRRDSFRLYGKSDGLSATVFNADAVLSLEDGRFIAGTTDGLRIVDPDAVPAHDGASPVHITQVRAGSRTTRLRPGGSRRLRLQWHERSPEIRFHAPNYSDPARTRYRWRMRGLDERWHEVVGDGRQAFGNLGSGRYRFEVRTAGAGGWSETGDHLELVVAPPAWRSGPALAGWAALALAGGGLAWRSGLRRARRRRRDRVARERLALAETQRDLVAELSATLDPTSLGRIIVTRAVERAGAGRAWLGFVHEDFPERIVRAGPGRAPARATFERALLRAEAGRPGAPGRFRLGTDDLPIAVLLVAGGRPDSGEIELLATAASQALDNARLLIEVRRLAERARDASRAKSEFLAVTSHEIRTPLHGMLGAMEQLQDEVSGSPTLRAMRTSGRQLKSILDDLLDLSRIESARGIRRSEPVDLPELLERLVALHASNAAAKGLDLRLMVSSRLPQVGFADEGALAQLLGNLLSNAVKFTERGAICVEAFVDRSGRTAVAVIDSGPGIRDSDRERLFEPFEQADSGSARRHEGTGLGLAICRRLAERMGAELELASHPGRGSRFTLRLAPDAAGARAARVCALPTGLVLATALGAEDHRTVMRLGRRHGFDVVRLGARVPEPEPGFDALLTRPGRIPGDRIRRWQRACAVWMLASSSEVPEGARGIAWPLTESGLLGALLELSLTRRRGGTA